LSKIIKGFKIKGEYKLNDIKIDKDSIADKGSKDKPTEKNKKKNKKKNSENNNKINPEILIDEAKKEAEIIINEAHKEADVILNEAREKAQKEGYEQGYEKGYQTGLAELSSAIDGLKNIVNKAEDNFEERKNKMAIDLIKLATKISGRIVNSLIDIKPELINEIIKDILDDLGNYHQDLKIKVNPDLLVYVNEVELLSDKEYKNISLEGDNTLEMGDCILETAYGGKDGSIENKLNILEKELMKGAGFHEYS